MLESLLDFEDIEKRPWVIFVWAFLISTVGILFSIQLSYTISVSGSAVELTGLFAVIFTIIPSVYLITVFIKKQEKMDERDIEKHYRKAFWERHERDIIIFLFFFFGLTFSFAFWAYALPAGTFQIQTMKINDIRMISGNIITGSAGANEIQNFTNVLANNLQVMSFAFIFSILFGAGAVFIVVWNASILGVYVGRLSESFLHIPVVSLNFLPHGIPEIGGYLIAGLAGGIISAAIIRGHKKEVFVGVCVDALKLFGLAILFVFLGALIETMGLAIKVASMFVFYTIFIFIVTKAFSSKRVKA